MYDVSFLFLAIGSSSFNTIPVVAGTIVVVLIVALVIVVIVIIAVKAIMAVKAKKHRRIYGLSHRR